MFNQKPLSGDLLDYGDPLSQGLVGLWLLNEGSGNKVFNLSGNGITGTMSADLSWTRGLFGPVIDFPGVTDFITTATLPGLVDGGAITYVVRFKSDIGSGGGDQVLIRLKDTAFKIDNAINENFVWFPNVGTAPVTCDFVFAANRWYEIAVTQVGTAYAMYVDGVQIQSGTNATIDMTSAVDVVIGAYNTTGTWDLNGQIDHVFVYNLALSASEIALIYKEPFRMIRTKRRRIIYDGVEAVPPTTFPYYYREIASRRIA